MVDALRFRCWKYVVAAALVTVVLGMTLKVHSLRQESSIRRCKAHLYEVAFAVSKYNQKHGKLPPAVVYEAGVPMHSWRVLILEFWQPDLFAQYRMSEPWNSPHNSKLANQMPHQYRCGLAPSKLTADQTTYVAVVGANTVLRTSEYDPRRQEDNPKDAVMLIELPDKPRHWMSPSDASPEEVAAYFSDISHDSPRHEHYSTADVRVRPVRELTAKELMDRSRCRFLREDHFRLVFTALKGPPH